MQIYKVSTEGDCEGGARLKFTWLCDIGHDQSVITLFQYLDSIEKDIKPYLELAKDYWI
ncbi:hypothetical protein SP19_161 [Salmonella phage 19]|nr:hypothetical protein SP19_161 [Salmonella phage 19]